MQKNILILLCGICLVTIAILSYSLVGRNDALRTAREARASVELRLLDQVEVNTRQRLDFERQLDALEERSLDLESQISSLRAALQDALAAADPDIDAIREQARREAESTQDNPRDLFSGIMRNFTEGDGARRMARIQVTGQYEEFLQQLDVDEITREEIRDALIDATAEATQRSMQMLSGDLSEEELASLSNGGFITDRMADILTEGQLQQFEEYQGNMAQRQLRNAYGMQLQMAAPNLNEQTRSTVLEVVVEELSSAQNATAGNGATAGFGTSMDRQMEAINQAQSRLSQTLTPDELRQTEAFFEQLELGVEMVRGMTSGLPAQPRQ